ncbi:MULTISPECIES: small highly charged protein [Shewanella]|jgi:hypothetical protein|uniref:small highly charged protein n=1 Tax=Shewanella TaxID=22 RepID=UPI000B8B37B9|nr:MULTISPECIES: small highly charged protein [Shewanella]EKT4488260.1 small highly charged protein [Shewanella algae]MBO2546966.1 small highly charged protein [Shewanella algae]MBO2555818.1 small highly charged protein [Shewanella algae]MBO2560156.1 small highly charged protein [Shewanella algae]MBO2572751.1 small highly charged protein [Shewanella algae]
MSNHYDFDDDDAPWGDHVRGKQKNKRVKQRRRDSKRRYPDEYMEPEFLRDKWK